MSSDITLPDAKFDHALDEYYAFLHAIVQNSGGAVGPGQRLVTLNTITPFSLVPGKPLYNTFVFRAYSDLVIRKINSSDTGSPKTPPQDIIDSANTSDSWSSEYFRFMFPLLSAELKKYIKDPAIQAQIDAKTTTWDGYYKAYVDELDLLEAKWASHAASTGLDEASDPKKYFSAKAEFIRKRKTKVEFLYDKQFALLLEIEQLEIDHLDSKGLLFKELRDGISKLNQSKLPIRPELEDQVVSDPTKNPGDYDIRPAIYPASGTQAFEALLDSSHDGDETAQLQRGYKILRTKQTTYTHDTDWSVSGSAKKFFFLKANLSVSEKKHFEEQISKVASIEIGFRAISDLLAVRGSWYSGAFLKSAEVEKWLNKQPEFREKLRNIITSIIVGRGLTVKLNFNSSIDQSSWTDLKTKGSGGIGIGGWNFGLSGHYNKKTSWSLKEVSDQTVTFVDAPNVCRVLGFKLEQVINDKVTTSAKHKIEYDTFSGLPISLLESYRSGAIDYASLQDAFSSNE